MKPQSRVRDTYLHGIVQCSKQVDDRVTRAAILLPDKVNLLLLGAICEICEDDGRLLHSRSDQLNTQLFSCNIRLLTRESNGELNR